MHDLKFFFTFKLLFMINNMYDKNFPARSSRIQEDIQKIYWISRSKYNRDLEHDLHQ